MTAAERGDHLLGLLRSVRTLPYGGEAVDQLSHALQCAQRARAAGADDQLVVACAFHDIGRAPAVRRLFPRQSHERAGEEFLRQVTGERAAWLVGAHVAAKRYLVAVEPGYAADLSRASTRSLQAQGGPLAGAELAAFEAHPWRADAVALRRWDEAAKAPDGGEVTLEELTGPLLAVLSAGWAR